MIIQFTGPIRQQIHPSGTRWPHHLMVGTQQGLCFLQSPLAPEIHQQTSADLGRNGTLHLVAAQWDVSKRSCATGAFLKWSYLQIHPFLDGFSIVNHPAIGVPPFQESSNMSFQWRPEHLDLLTHRHPVVSAIGPWLPIRFNIVRPLQKW